MGIIVGLLKWLLYLAVGLVLALALFVFAARFADGPYSMIPGGKFISGEPHLGPEPDWSFVKDRQEVEFQLMDPERSRITWILEHQGRIYIPCGYMNTNLGRLWKRWPIEAEQGGRAVLRIDDVLYDRQLVRIKEGEQLPALLSELSRKYVSHDVQLSPDEQAQALAHGLQQIADGSTWIFELAPRD